MSTIDQHLIHHTRLDAVTAVFAYIGAFFILVFAIQSRSTAELAVLTPASALIMMGATALVLELVRVAPHAEG